MKKWFRAGWFALFCLLVLSVCAVAVSAADLYTISPYAETIRNYEKAYNEIYGAIEKQRTYLDITSLRIHDYDIMRIFEDVLGNSPEFFYVRNILHFRYKNGYVTSLSFSYSMGTQKRKEATTFYQTEISSIVTETENLCETDVEKALYVHDLLIASFRYDEDESIYDAYHFLSEKKGVCQAYALTYMAILREMDIPCFLVKSGDGNHSWNLVEIDDTWYHVDLTYDDPRPDRPGRVLHEYFLLSDNGIATASVPHTGWASVVTCDDAGYENGLWRNTDSRMVVMDGKFVYIRSDRRSIERSDLAGNDFSVLYLFKEHWFVDQKSGAYWSDVCSGLAAYEEYLYYNTPTSIWRLDTTNGATSIILTLNEADPNRNLYGFDIYKGNMEYLVGDDPNREKTAYLRQLKMSYATKPETVENVFLPFADVSRVSPYYDAIDYAYRAGYMIGYNKNTFAPRASLTRAQFAAILYRVSNATASATETRYMDVSPHVWYAKYIGWVTEAGFMQGTDKDLFSPEKEISREEAYTVFSRFAADILGTDTKTTRLPCIDRSAISRWASYGVTYCYHMGLVEEKFSYILAPQTPLTRCELAEILYRMHATEGAAS